MQGRGFSCGPFITLGRTEDDRLEPFLQYQGPLSCNGAMARGDGLSKVSSVAQARSRPYSFRRPFSGPGPSR